MFDRIFQVPKDGSSSIGFANRAIAQKSKSHTGAIVGGVVGGVIGLIIIALGGWYYFYYHRRLMAAHGGTLDEDKPANLTPFPAVGQQPQHNAPSTAVYSNGGLHSPSVTGFSEAQTIVYDPSSIGRPGSSLMSSPSQVVFVNQAGQIVSPTSPHSPTPLLQQVGDDNTAPPAYEEREPSEAAGSSSSGGRRARPREKGSAEPSS